MNKDNAQNRASYQFAEGLLSHAIHVSHFDGREIDELDNTIIDWLANHGEAYGQFEGNQLFTE